MTTTAKKTRTVARLLDGTILAVLQPAKGVNVQRLIEEQMAGRLILQDQEVPDEPEKPEKSTAGR